MAVPVDVAEAVPAALPAALPADLPANLPNALPNAYQKYAYASSDASGGDYRFSTVDSAF